MTELQIKAAQLAEDKRHNIKTERLTQDLNAAQAKHLSTSDAYTEAHYQRGDTAGLISANANAMNAQTNQSKYNMEYDIEYGWTGSYGYPKGMPLSAQRKSMEMEIMALSNDSNLPATQYAIEEKKANISKANAEALNKRATAFTNVMNSILGNTFGKGGIIKTIDEIG